METTIHTYYLHMDKAEDRKAYDELKAKMAARGTECFCTWGGGSHYQPKLDGLSITLETKHLFDNQWSTAPIEGVSDKGLRVFDWAEDYPINFSAKLKRGHWLDITPEMVDARRNRNKCGYCGHQEEAQRGLVFCDRCLDSPYLQEKDLPLLRMRCVADNTERPPLTKAEREHLLPLYKAAQIHGSTERGKARTAKVRAGITAKREKTISTANTEYHGLLWLLDHAINTENVIFYSHTGRFCFGWRQPITGETRDALLEALAAFPFPYDVK